MFSQILTKMRESDIKQAYVWTITPPTTTGLYWAFDGDEVVPVDVYVNGLGGTARLVGFELGNDYTTPRKLSDYSHWIGPLPVPEPPEEL